MPKVLIPLAQGCEELEAVTLIDLLRRAGVEVITAGLDEQVVTASRGVKLIPDVCLAAVLDEDFDMMVLPGGLPGATHLDDDPRIHTLLKRLQKEGKSVAAICAAPKVLAHAGLLAGKQATCYPGVLTALNNSDIQYIDAPVLKDGQVITSRGPGTAIAFALELIEVLQGKERREVVEKQLVS